MHKAIVVVASPGLRWAVRHGSVRWRPYEKPELDGG
jgi:hypothetical protein